MFLARKVKLAKWASSPALADGEISADAVTADLRTRQLSLSFWECGSGEESQLMDVVLALASGADQVETIDLVWLQEEDLRNDGHSVSRQQGRTAAADLASKHVEVGRLDYRRLGKVAGLVVGAIADGRCRSFKRSRVVSALTDAVRMGRVPSNGLAPKVRAVVTEGNRASH